MSKMIREKHLINLFRGWPNRDLLAPASISAAVNDVLSDEEVFEPVLQYAPDWGIDSLRTELAKFLNRFYQPNSPVNELRLCITGGASQSLAVILQACTDPIYTRAIWMISPTFYLACPTFEDAGFYGRLRAVKEEDDWSVLEQEMEMVEHAATKEDNVKPKMKPNTDVFYRYKHIIYCVPSFSNPSGATMSLKKREDLVRIARQFDALIVCDDVYDQLQWHATSPEPLTTCIEPRVVDIDRTLDGGPRHEFGHAVSNASFTKICAPGCRTGWVEAEPKLAYALSQVGSSRAGGAPSAIIAAAMGARIANGDFEKHIETVLKPAYQRRWQNLSHYVRTELGPLGVVLDESNVHKGVAGGYFMWIVLPPGVDGDELAKRCLTEEKLIIAQGSMFRVYGDERHDATLKSRVRLTFAYEAEKNLAEGICRLRTVLEKMVSS